MPKPLIITDDSVVNSYGFRVMSDGGMVEDYLKNPIMLYNHARSYDESNKNVILPIGKMNSLTRQGTQWIATPDFDLEDEFAAEVARKYEKDILNMASIGFEALEWSTEPEVMLPGQTMPTITKWRLKEVSITDIGANTKCTKLSHAGITIQLNEKTSREELENFFNQSINQTATTMKKVITALNNSKLMNLSDASGEELVAEGINTLVNALSARDASIQTKDAEILRLTEEAKTAKAAGLKDKATALVDAALSAKKIVALQKDKFVTLASVSEEGYEAVKAMLDSMTGYVPAAGQVNLNNNTELPKSKEKLIELYNKHAKDATFGTLSADDIKTLWKAKHGKEISEETLNALSAQ